MGLIGLLLIGTILLLPAAAIAGAMTTGSSGLQGDSGSGEPGDGSGKDDSPGAKAEQASMFGVFSAEENNVTGRFVSFEFDANLGAIYNYTLQLDEATKIFSSLVIEAFELIAGLKKTRALCWL